MKLNRLHYDPLNYSFWLLMIKGRRSFFGIHYSSLAYLEGCLALGQTWGVEYFADSLLGFSLTEIEPSCTSVSQNMSSDWLFRVSMSHCVSWISHYLICHINGHVKLLGQFHKFAQNFSQHLLSLRELSSSGIIIPKDGHDGVYDEEGVGAFHHHCGCEVEKSDEVFYCVSSGVSNVLQRLFGVKFVSFCYFDDPFRPESSLGINVDHLSISTALLPGQLSCDAQRMGQLRFTCPELSKSLSNCHALYASSKQLIQNR